MSIAELRRQAKQTIDRMSGPRLRVVTDLLLYIQQARSNDATRELLESPGFLKSFSRGIADLRAGRIRGWRKVRAAMYEVVLSREAERVAASAHSIN